MQTTHSGDAVNGAMPSIFAQSGTNLMILKLEERIAFMESEIERVSTNANIANDRIDSLVDEIDRLKQENDRLRDELTKRGSGKSLADRILDYFLNESTARSIRSSEIRKRFEITSHGHIIYAMRGAAEKSSGKLMLTTFSSKTGDEYALVKL